MPVVIIVGVQWGDEGKGKVVDYLTEQASLVVRFQGGNNAGHTVVVEGTKTALQLVPSGILRKGTRCLLAPGVVVNPWSLIEEFERLAKSGINVTPERFGIAGEVQLILPYHQAVDLGREAALKGGKIGTTGKGIGPAYEDAVSRYGVRLIDLFHPDNLRNLIERNVGLKNNMLRHVIGASDNIDSSQLFDQLSSVGEKLKPFVTNVSVEVDKAIREKRYIVFEGAQGSLLDVNHGTYPYVTSSNTLAGFACASAGFGPRHVDHVLGICKAYCTRVGSGPFPTEDTTKDGDTMRAKGNEFGTVTGRPRRCGWFDGVAAKKAIRLNGIDTIVVTKLDVLSGFPRLKLARGYRVDGKEVDELPVSCSDIGRIEPIYEEVDGWMDDITGVRSFDELPAAAKKFMNKLREIVGCEVGGFSIGPNRDQTIVMSERLSSLTSR